MQEELNRSGQSFGKIVGEIVAEARDQIQLDLDATGDQVRIQVFNLVARGVPVSGH
jgi:hypothetical protein